MEEPTAASDWRQLDAGLAIVHPVLADLLAFWDRSRRGRAMPGRADFAPADLVEHLGWVILVDVEDPPLRFRFRLIGTGITAALSRDSTGRYLDELYDAAIYDEAVRPYVYVTRHCRPVRSTGRMVHADKGHIPYEALYLPYSETSDRVDMVMERVQYGGLA